MARQLRPNIEGSWHHITNRGAGRQPVFLCDEDRYEFLDLLALVHERYQIETHAYCMMTTHFHLLWRLPKATMSEAAQLLFAMYTRRFNQRHDRDGPLLRSRYYSSLIDSEEYLLAAAKYIHRNPVEAGITTDRELHLYKWSSFPAYVGFAEAQPWLRRGELLVQFGARAEGGSFQSETRSPRYRDGESEFLGSTVARFANGV